MQTAASASVNQPFYLVHLDVVGDPLWAWTGRGNLTVTVVGDPLLSGGRTFVGAADIAAVQGLTHAADGSVQTMTMMLGNADFTDPAAYEFVNTEASWSRRLAVIWAGFVSTATGLPVADPVRIMTGRLLHVSSTDGAQPSIVVKVAAKSGYDGQRASNWQLAGAHQKAFYPGDNALDFIPQLVGKELRFGTPDAVQRSMGVGGSIGRGLAAGAGQVRNQ
ncbi:hypothetical protein [Sandarakinorhabdus sp. DWP1-3-1]|uniref:hypothetical protein n=1 Tax=Sandarakinorhabdus sp. DWP1-3-1 TaxID=2804627 RepID=UPI003CF899E7